MPRTVTVTALVTSLLVLTAAEASAWRIERATYSVGRYPTIALTAEGRPLVGYDSVVTAEATERMGPNRPWNDVVVVDHGFAACHDVNYGREIATAPSGVVTFAGACDVNANNPDVQVSSRIDGVWTTIEPVQVPRGDFCIDTVWFDMVLHPVTGKPWVAYSESFYKSLTIAREVEGSWLEIHVPAPSVEGCLEGPVFEMAFAPDMTLGVAVTTRFGRGPLVLLERAKGTKDWVESPITSNAVGRADLAYTSDGTALVAFRQPDPAGGQQLALATRPPAGTWSVDVVDTASFRTGFDPSLGIRGSEIVLAYRDDDARAILVATGAPDAWAVSTVIAERNPWRPSLTVGADGRLHLAFEAGRHDIWYARGT